MLEIFLILIGILIPLGLAKRGRGKRRRFREYIRGNIDEELSITGLAANDLISITGSNVVDEKTFVTSVELYMSLSKLTPVDAVGPFLVGVAHSDYSDVEIEAWIERAASWTQADLVAREINARKIKRIGTISSSGGGLSTDSWTLNDGRPMKVKLNWMLYTSDTLKYWIYNDGVVAVQTTSPLWNVQGTAHLWPA